MGHFFDAVNTIISSNSSYPKITSKRSKTYNSGDSLVIADPTTESADLWLMYGRANGMPSFQQSMVVCDCMSWIERLVAVVVFY